MAGGYQSTLQIRGLQSFLWTQFLGAFNDNVFKIVVTMLAVHAASRRRPGPLSLVGAVFILPFLLFSGYAGQLADAVQQAHGAGRHEGPRDRRHGPGHSALATGHSDLTAGRAVSDGAALDVLQPGEVRNPAGDRCPNASCRARTGCSR